MIRPLIRFLLFLATAALGLLVASLIVPGFQVQLSGFLTTIVFFAVAQSLLGPLVFSLAAKHARAILGGVGLVSTFLALLIAWIFSNGLRIDDAVGWIGATVVVWLVTALGTWLLPLIFLTKRAGERRNR